MGIEIHLQNTRKSRFLILISKNCFKYMTKVAFSFCNELVSTPNKQDAMLSSVYWPFSLILSKNWIGNVYRRLTYSLISNISCLSAYSKRRLLKLSLTSFIKPYICKGKVIIEDEWCWIDIITAFIFAVENVGETIDRAFFHCSSSNTVNPCSKGPPTRRIT